MNFEIRKCNINDAIFIQKINKVELGYDVSMEKMSFQLEKLLQSTNDLILVAVSDNIILGYIHAHDYCTMHQPHMITILGIAVLKEYQNNGIGTALLKAIEQWAYECNAIGIRLVSNVNRITAHTFYIKCGYEITKLQYNFKKWIDKEKFLRNVCNLNE